MSEGLSRADWAVACVLVSALEGGRLTVETDEELANRQRWARMRVEERTAEGRAEAREMHAQVKADEQAERCRVILLLRSGSAEARAWVVDLERRQVVRVACAMARRAAKRRRPE